MLSQFADARILAIDDTPANLSLIEGLLRRAGLHNVHTLGDSRAALDVLAEVDPDLVLLDLHMPHVDGYAVLEEIVRRSAGGYLPVLVLTADTTARAAHRALAAGARDFLTKPFDAHEVLLRVGNLLETRDLHQRLRRISRHLAGELSQFRRVQDRHAAALEATRSAVGAVLAAGGPEMVFQPVIDLSLGHLAGYEALARFPGDYPRTPDLWFADANEVGLGPALELAAIGGALDVLPSLGADQFLALNVSPETLLRSDLCDVITLAAGPQIVLELTEHVPIEDYAPVLRALAPLRSRGVRIAVDDTGAGYASLRHMLALEPDVIKLDVSLVRNIESDPARRALAAALVGFARDTGLTVVAEGVETSAELDVLRVLGIDWAQGFHLGEPQGTPTPAPACACGWGSADHSQTPPQPGGSAMTRPLPITASKCWVSPLP